jgi:RNA polymerase sigma-70 factor (ECF subfamily)
MDQAERFRRLQDLYPTALPEVYGYLRHRTGDPALAEDLAAETFLQAARSLRDGTVAAVTTAWLVTVARNKLVDHWRKESRTERALRPVAVEPDQTSTDCWDAHLDAILAVDVLRSLSTHHRAALTLRYVDDLPVAQVAALLDRTVHATEALLVRARTAFRRAYEAQGGGG